MASVTTDRASIFFLKFFIKFSLFLFWFNFFKKTNKIFASELVISAFMGKMWTFDCILVGKVFFLDMSTQEGERVIQTSNLRFMRSGPN